MQENDILAQDKDVHRSEALQLREQLSQKVCGKRATYLFAV